MKKLFDISIQNRKILHRFLKEIPKEKLLEIPDGFRNNIWWNIAHIVVTQQLLVYRFSGQPVLIPEEFIAKFKKGTVPDGMATDAEIKALSTLMFSTIEQSEADYDKGIFKNFTEYTTSANVTLRSVEDAIAFNVFHEGLHLGAILSLRKLL